MEKVQKRQNSSINFLRFLFTVGICFMHLVCQVITPYIAKPLPYNNFGAISFCVEMFFIMAGYFLFFSNNSLKKYILKRIARLWPLLAFSTIIAGILRTFHISMTSLTLGDIWNLLFLQGTGLYQGCATNGPAWFVGVLFWVSLVYLLLKIKLSDKNLALITSFIIAISIFLLWLPKGDIIFTNARGYSPIGGGWISIMMLRGFIAIGLGVLLGIFQKYTVSNLKFQHLQNLSKSKIVFTAIEIILFICLCKNLIFGYNSIKLICLYFISLILFSMMFFLFIGNLGYFSSIILNKKIFNTLGNYSYSIYIMQNVVFYIIDYCLKTYPILTFHPYFVIIISMLLFLSIGIGSYYIVNSITNYLSNLINKNSKIKEICS